MNWCSLSLPFCQSSSFSDFHVTPGLRCRHNSVTTASASVCVVHLKSLQQHRQHPDRARPTECVYLDYCRPPLQQLSALSLSRPLLGSRLSTCTVQLYVCTYCETSCLLCCCRRCSRAIFAAVGPVALIDETDACVVCVCVCSRLAANEAAPAASRDRLLVIMGGVSLKIQTFRVVVISTFRARAMRAPYIGNKSTGPCGET